MLAIFGLSLIAFGFAIFFMLDRSKFYRTNSSGVEMYASYGEKVKAIASMFFFRVLMAASFVIGILSVFYYYLHEEMNYLITFLLKYFQ